MMLHEIVLPFFLSFFVHLWSTVVGGGGALLIPGLIVLGYSPQVAIATNRFAALSGAFSIFQFHKQGNIHWKLGAFLAIFAGMGSVIGSFLLLKIDTDIIERGIGVIILLSLPMFLLRPQAGVKQKYMKMTKLKHLGGGAMMLFFGILGGFFSSAGVWFSYTFIFYYGLTFLQTAATRRLIGLAMVGLSLIVLIPSGIIHWPTAISMFAGGGLGSMISAHFAHKLGNQLVRYVFLAVMLMSGIHLLLFS